jgi:hypothetical protein
MPEPEDRKRWQPTRTNLVAGGMVVAGFMLTGINWWFLLLAALGTFGPGILREIGWLSDKDEFQRQAGYRAGYHAFLTAGLVSFYLMAFFRSEERMVKDPEELATLFLAILWFTWFLSSLLDYWGPQKTAARILCAFGSVWLVFTVVSNLGSEWTGWMALLLHPLLTLPFFVLAWLSQRWPRTTGVLLLVASIFFMQLFGFFRSSPLGLVTRCITFTLFLGPLLASGIALLCSGKECEAAER